MFGGNNTYTYFTTDFINTYYTKAKTFKIELYALTTVNACAKKYNEFY